MNLYFPGLRNKFGAFLLFIATLALQEDSQELEIYPRYVFWGKKSPLGGVLFSQLHSDPIPEMNYFVFPLTGNQEDYFASSFSGLLISFSILT